MPSLQRVLFVLVARMIVSGFVNCRMVFDMPENSVKEHQKPTL